MVYYLRGGESDMKSMRHLAELNYSKAATLFLQLENPVDILKVQLDRAVLIEDQIQGMFRSSLKSVLSFV